MAASFVVGVQLARLLGPAGYGAYGMALAIVTMCGIPGEMGLPRLVTREVSVAEARKDEAWLFGVLRWADKVSLRISAGMVLAMAGLSFELYVTGRSELAFTLIAGTPIVPLMAWARIRGGGLQGLHQIVLGQLPDALVRPAIYCALIFGASLTTRHFGPALAMGLYSITAVAVLILAHRLLRSRLPSRRPPRESLEGRGWLASSLPMALTEAMRVLQAELPLLFLGFLVAPADAGLFRIANVTAYAAATPVAIIDFVSFAIVARLYASKDFVRLQAVLTRLAQAQFAGVFLLCLPLFVAPSALIALVYGKNFVPATSAVQVLAFGLLLSAGFGTNVSLLNMTNHERRVTRAMVLAVATNIIGVAALAPLFGATGAALGVTGGVIVWNLATWVDARRLLRLETSILPIRVSGDAPA